MELPRHWQLHFFIGKPSLAPALKTVAACQPSNAQCKKDALLACHALVAVAGVRDTLHNTYLLVHQYLSLRLLYR